MGNEQTWIAYHPGTPRTRAALFDHNGRRLVLLSEASPLERTRSEDGAEHLEIDFEACWRQFAALMRRLAEARPEAAGSAAGLAFAAEAHTFAPLDETGRPLRKGFHGADCRAVEESVHIDAWFLRHTYFHTTGNPEFSPAHFCSKLEWLRRHEPAIVDGTWKFAFLRDFLAYRLTGTLVSDRTLMTIGGVYHPVMRGPWLEMLYRIRLDKAKLPEVSQPWATAGTVTAEAAAETGLPEGLPVTLGGLETALAGLGAGNTEPGHITLHTADRATQLATWGKQFYDRQYRMEAGRHVFPNGFYLLPSVPSAGSLTDWFTREIAGGADPVALDREAEAAGPGAGGVLLAPHFEGETSPRPTPDERGHFTGLAIGHGRGHLYRALLEGIAFAIAENVDLLRGLGLAVKTVNTIGDAATRGLWSRIQADVLDFPLAAPEEPEGALLGAVILAAAGHPDRITETARRFYRVRGVVEPHPETARYYRERRALWRELLVRAREVPLLGGGGEAPAP